MVKSQKIIKWLNSEVPFRMFFAIPSRIKQKDSELWSYGSCGQQYILPINVLKSHKKTEPQIQAARFMQCSPAICMKPVAFRPCLTTGLAFITIFSADSLSSTNINVNQNHWFCDISLTRKFSFFFLLIQGNYP